jgi:chromosome segregation ATPase
VIEKIITNLHKKIQDRGVNVVTEQLEHKRLNVANRVKINESKFAKLEQELTDSKNTVFKVDRAIRDAKLEIEKLNAILELKQEEDKKAQANVENVKEVRDSSS